MADPTRYRGERGRGFGDDRYGQRGGGDWGYPREDRGRFGAGGGGGRERDEDRRDYGDAAGYGGGGSWRDFREGTGRDWDDDRFRNPDEVFQGRPGRSE